jgi:hypothetical protein
LGSAGGDDLIERIGGCLEVPSGKMQVNRGCFQIRVAQHHLNAPQVGAGFQEVSCEAMATIPGPE